MIHGKECCQDDSWDFSLKYHPLDNDVRCGIKENPKNGFQIPQLLINTWIHKKRDQQTTKEAGNLGRTRRSAKSILGQII